MHTRHIVQYCTGSLHRLKEASELSCLIFFHPQRDLGKGHAVAVVTVIQSDWWSLPPNINQAYTWMVLVGWVNSTPLMHLNLSYYWEIIIEAAGFFLTRNPINSPQKTGCRMSAFEMSQSKRLLVIIIIWISLCT